MSADDVLPPRPARDVDLRHGYTLYQVNALSIWTVQQDRYHSFADFDERLEVAWHAIIEHIYTCADPPEVPEVIRAGWRAIGQDFGKNQRFHGTSHSPDHDAIANSGFERYWHSTGQPISGHDERVTEDLALAQIWPRLRPQDRELLAAMAEHEDYGKAAAALGKTRHTYATQIGRARRAFRELWHEGETPSRPWGADRRPYKADSPATPGHLPAHRPPPGRPNARQRPASGQAATRHRASGRTAGTPMTGPLSCRFAGSACWSPRMAA
jgi:hypothetical protein